ALVGLLLVMPVAARFHCPTGRARLTMTLVTVALACLGASGFAIVLLKGWNSAIDPESPVGRIWRLLTLSAWIGTFASNWIAVWLTMPRSKPDKRQEAKGGSPLRSN